MDEPRLEVRAGQEKGSIIRDREAGVIYCHASDVDELALILEGMKYRGDRQRPEWPENVWGRDDNDE